MVELALPANSKVRTGHTHPVPKEAKNLKAFKVYRWTPEDGETPRVDTYHDPGPPVREPF